MPSWLIDAFNNIIPSIIIAAFTSYLTVCLAINRFYKEKWWEKKMEAYSSLLETLHHMKNYAAEHWEDTTNPEYLNEEKRKELENEWKKYSREFKKTMDLASFLLSKQSLNILEEYKKRKTEAKNSPTVFEHIDKDLAALSDCLEKLIRAAKCDLRIRKYMNFNRTFL